MRKYPKDADDWKEAEELNAKDWQVELLKKNPEYVYWGNYEDYMSGGSGWDKPLEFDSIEGGLFGLDELNELVHFYFNLNRKSEDCTMCDGSGENPETKKLSDDWYSFDKTEWMNTSGGRRYNNAAWQYHLTEVEIEALVKAGRLNDLTETNCYFEDEENQWYGWIDGEKQKINPPKMPTPEEVNEWSRTNSTGHDSINRWIAVEARAKHLGVYGHCEHCEGRGYNYTEPEAKVGLQLWYLHPRKGCSRGVYIKEIHENEIPKIVEFLKEARERNQDRFSNL